MTCAAAALVLGLGGAFMPLDVSGMREIADTLDRTPRVHVEIFHHDADQAMTDFARQWAWKCSIVFVAHSAGVNGAVRAAHRLLPEAIPIALLVAFDPPDRPTLPLPPAPANVERVYLYRQDGILGGGRMKRAPGNLLTAQLENRTVDGAHITMPRRFAPEVLRDVTRLVGK